MKKTKNPKKQTQANPHYVRSKTELANALGIDRGTLYRWMPKPGTPSKEKDGRYDVEKWRKWQNENSFRTVGNSPMTAEDRATLNSLKGRLLQAKIEAVELQNAVASGKMANADEVCRVVTAPFAEMIAALRQTKHRIGSQVVGLSAGEIEKVLNRDLADCMRKWQLGEWAKNHPFYGGVYHLLKKLHAEHFPEFVKHQ